MTKIQDYIAGDRATLDVHATPTTVTFSVWEAYGGGDEGPVSASITITRDQWLSMIHDVRQQMEAAKFKDEADLRKRKGNGRWI